MSLDKGRFKQWMLELAVITMERKGRMNKLVRTLSNSLRDKDERKEKKSNTDLSRMSIWSFYLMEIGKTWLLFYQPIVLKADLFQPNWIKVKMKLIKQCWKVLLKMDLHQLWRIYWKRRKDILFFWMHYQNWDLNLTLVVRVTTTKQSLRMTSIRYSSWQKSSMKCTGMGLNLNLKSVIH